MFSEEMKAYSKNIKAGRFAGALCHENLRFPLFFFKLPRGCAKCALQSMTLYF